MISLIAEDLIDVLIDRHNLDPLELIHYLYTQHLLEDGVVGRADHVDARIEQALSGVFERLHAVDLERDVLHPGRGVFVATHGRRIGQLEEGQHIAAAGIQEDVHVGIGRLGGGHFVFGNRQHEFHAEVFLIPLHGFLGVLATVGDVVNFLSEHGASPVVWNAPIGACFDI